MSKRSVMVEYAKSFMGTPYKWGGDDPDGIDCSGLVLECLWSVGLGPGTDVTAHGLFDWLTTDHPHTENPEAGTIIFFKKNGRVSHCAIAIDEEHMVEAKGSEFVRVRPIWFYKNSHDYYFIDPVN